MTETQIDELAERIDAAQDPARAEPQPGKLYRATVYGPTFRRHFIMRPHARQPDELVAIYAPAADGGWERVR